MRIGSMVIGRVPSPPIGTEVAEKDGRVYRKYAFGWVRIA
jgi:hypothetical protein